MHTPAVYLCPPVDVHGVLGTRRLHLEVHQEMVVVALLERRDREWREKVKFRDRECCILHPLH